MTMKHIFVFDQDKCSACSACMMGCMDQNDIDLAAGDQCFRKTYDNELKLKDGSNYCVYISAACMHCTDAPCIAACPVGCISKDPETGFTVYDNTTVSGSQVVNAIRKFYQKDQFGIRVITGKNKSYNLAHPGLYYGYDVNSDGTINFNAMRNTDVYLATDEALDSYVNPSGKFKASLVVDSSNVTRAIVFDQQ